MNAAARPAPLAGVRILSLEQFGAGPWGSQQLVDLGAEVVKIEDPLSRGDVGRYVPPFQDGEDSLFFETFNRNKKSVSLDLRSSAGREVLHALVATADGVFSNLRGTQPSQLGLTYADLRAANPRIVCCALSGFGRTGPRAPDGAYDYVLQGIAGWMSLTGSPDGPPAKSGLSLVDYIGGYVSALALVAGIWRARRDGQGGDCDVSLFESALSQLTYLGTWAATTDYIPERTRDSAHPSIVPFQVFETADSWIVVACAKQTFWERLCDVIGRPDLKTEPAFIGLADRYENRDELLPILGEIFRERTSATWLAMLGEQGIPSGPINDVPTALLDPQLDARGGLLAYEHPRFGTVRQVPSPLRMDDLEPVAARAPFRGEHTVELLRNECGFSDERIRELAFAGTFGPQDDAVVLQVIETAGVEPVESAQPSIREQDLR
jgi:crotonobetainyl-CoA:carnitine CoA-transferase CaiB-like acyl-CoA transferase